MSVFDSGRRILVGAAAMFLGGLVALGTTGCAGEKLKGDASGIQTKLQRAIRDGSKTIGCAPKETALAEANIKFAEDALIMGEFYRGKEHVELADIYTKLAIAKTDPVKCRDPGQVAPTPGDISTDRDQDGYDDDVDQCPDDPEDIDGDRDEDGCPDVDTDGDGLEDDVDKCPQDPEDKDGFEDEDGCPEGQPIGVGFAGGFLIADLFHDGDGEGGAGAAAERLDLCEAEAEDFGHDPGADGEIGAFEAEDQRRDGHGEEACEDR